MHEEKPDTQDWYFTFGSGQRLFACHADGTHGYIPGKGIPVDDGYVKLRGTSEECRDFMVHVFGTIWSGQYDRLPVGFAWWRDLTVLVQMYVELASPAELRGET